MGSLGKHRSTNSCQINKETLDIIRDYPLMQSTTNFTSRPFAKKSLIPRHIPHLANKLITKRKPFSIKLNQKSSLALLKPSQESENTTFPTHRKSKDLSTKKGKNLTQPDEKLPQKLQQDTNETILLFNINENEELLNNLQKYKSNATYENPKIHSRNSIHNSKILQNPPVEITTPKAPIFISTISQTDIINIENKNINEFSYPNAPKQNLNTKNYNKKNYINPLKLFGSKTKALVTSYKIDISLKEYEIKYYINSSLDTIFIHVLSYNEKYDMEFNTETQDPILEVIKEKIHPFIDIKQGKLVLVPVTVDIVMRGMHAFMNKKYNVCVEKRTPRYEIVIKCEFDDRVIEKNIPYIEIPFQYREAKIDAEMFFTCFYIKDENIIIEFPNKNNFQMIYYKAYGFNYQSYHIKISEISQKNNNFLLIQALSKKSSPINSLFIDIANVSIITNIHCDSIKDDVNKIISFLVVKNSQIILRTYLEEDRNREAEMKDENNLVVSEKKIDTRKVFKGFLEMNHFLNKNRVFIEEESKRN
ncbi:hypothetical protein SteCoe_31981 [Stentor coeruleus]|uniref:Uncharacterized protein n=1 Tax=Stentor coeruleus TaxID=5963 RepID=A0A1R2B018_9CILI|nr:hypothetical protein SteCoe_31981 [Stentor coeruleus]